MFMFLLVLCLLFLPVCSRLFVALHSIFHAIGLNFPLLERDDIFFLHSDDESSVPFLCKILSLFTPPAFSRDI